MQLSSTTVVTRREGVKSVDNVVGWVDVLCPLGGQRMETYKWLRIYVLFPLICCKMWAELEW